MTVKQAYEFFKTLMENGDGDSLLCYESDAYTNRIHSVQSLRLAYTPTDDWKEQSEKSEHPTVVLSNFLTSERIQNTRK